MYVCMYLTTGIHYLHFSNIYIYYVIDNLVQQITLPSTVNTFKMIKTKIYSGTMFLPHGKAETGDVRVRTHDLEMQVCFQVVWADWSSPHAAWVWRLWIQDLDSRQGVLNLLSSSTPLKWLVYGFFAVCLVGLYVCGVGGVSYCICACTRRTVAGIISPVLYTLLIPRPGLSLARDLPVWLCWLTNKLQGACLPLYGEYAIACGYFSWLLGILLLI